MLTLRVASRLLLVAMVLIGRNASAQEGTPAPVASPETIPTPRPSARNDIQRVFVIKHVNAQALMRVLQVFPAAFRSGTVGQQDVVTVSAAPTVMATIEEAIKRLDVPDPSGRSIDVTIHLLECATAAGEPDATPAELRDVVTQLKKTFSYSACRVGETLFTRTNTGNVFRLTSRVAGANAQKGDYYDVTARIDAQAGTPEVIQFKDFAFRDAAGWRSFRGDVTVREGQHTVLGTVGAAVEGKVAVIVLTARTSS